MSDPNEPVPPPDSPPFNGGRYGRPAQRRGASRYDAVPRMENVRVTAPDLERRAALEQTRSRLVIAAGGFTVLFSRQCWRSSRWPPSWRPLCRTGQSGRWPRSSIPFNRDVT